MTQQQLADFILNKIVMDIDQFKESPAFNHSYWGGYAHAIEESNGIGKNDLWHPVKQRAIDYCDKLRGNKPIAGITKVK